MKTTQFISEAVAKPSDIKKYNTKSHKETVHFKSGDIYDFSDPGYEDEFIYYDGSGDGYIKDKQGHVYDVVINEYTSDAGRIAGGCRNFSVTIKKANGKDDFYVSGYTAIMSTPKNAGCIADIKAGNYLEDYIAKYYNKYDHGDKFKELAEKGDKKAKSYDNEKAEKKQAKDAEFDSRYLRLPDKIYWEVNDNGFEIIKWYPIQVKNNDEYDSIKKERDNYRISSSEWKEFNGKLKEIEKKANAIIFDVFKQKLIDKIQEILKTKDINTFKGISGAFAVPNDYSQGKKNWGQKTLAIDTKKKILVAIHTGDRKVLDNEIEMEVCDYVTLDKSQMNEKTEKLFKTVAKAWKKTEGRKQTEYIANNWERIQRESGGYWKWNKTAGQAKKEAKEEFLNYIKKHDWDSNNILTFSLALIQLYVEGDFSPEQEPIENPLQNPEPIEKKQRGKDTKMSKGANNAAYEKMKAWHEGTRKQNLSNCSDAKLKMNYKVCKELGYEKEMKQIEDEANKRNLQLESLSLKDYITFAYESKND